MIQKDGLRLTWTAPKPAKAAPRPITDQSANRLFMEKETQFFVQDPPPSINRVGSRSRVRRMPHCEAVLGGGPSASVANMAASEAVLGEGPSASAEIMAASEAVTALGFR